MNRMNNLSGHISVVMPCFNAEQRLLPSLLAGSLYRRLITLSDARQREGAAK